MARPTIAQIRRALEDLGLPQVDPNSWFDGTMPEILRVILDAGPIKALPTFNFMQNNLFTSAANTSQTFDITGANPGTIRIVNNMTVEIITANINRLRFQHFDGTVTDRVWDEINLANFAVGPHIGTANQSTEAWGAQGLSSIVLYPPELTTNPNNQRQLQLRLFSAAAVVKTVDVNLNVTEFDSRLFAGGHW